VFRHESGTTSSVLLTQFAPAAAVGFEAVVWGERGLLPMPPRPETALPGLLATAAKELLYATLRGEPHEIDVAFGVRNVEVLAAAQAQLDAARGG
jgi:hypothetical protein